MRSFELRETNNGFIVKITKIDPSGYLQSLQSTMTQEEYCFTTLDKLIDFLDEKLSK